MRTSASSAWPACAWATCVAPAALIDEIDKVRPPYNVSVLNAEAALFALDHADEYARQAALLRDRARAAAGRAGALPGVQPFPSEANMVLVRVPDSKPPSTA
jgi:histidinol-phosphate aminotransferase